MFLRLASLGLVLMLGGCATLVQPPAPPLGGPSPEPPTSTFTVPVKLPLSRLAAAADSLLSGRPSGVFFVSDQTIADGVTLQMGLHRSGPTTVGSDGGAMVLSVPLTVDAGKVDVEKHVGTLTLRAHAEFTASLRVTARLRLSVSPDWKLVAKVEPSFSWIDDPTVLVSWPLLPAIRVGVEPFVTPLVNQRLSALAEQVQTFLAEVPLRAAADEVWRQIQVPVRLAGAPMYLEVTPVVLSLAGASVEDGALVVRPTMAAVLQAQRSPSPPLPAGVPLPPNEGAAGEGLTANIAVPASFAELEALANGRMKGRTFVLAGGGKVRPVVMTVSSAGSRLVLGVDFDASLPGLFHFVRGRLYVWATPLYDEAAKRLVLTQLELVESTNSALVSVADALADRSWLEQLEQLLTFDLAPHLDPLMETLTSPVRTTVVPGVDVEVTWERLVVHSLAVTDKGVAVTVTGTGHAAVTVDPNAFFALPTLTTGNPD